MTDQITGPQITSVTTSPVRGRFHFCSASQQVRPVMQRGFSLLEVLVAFVVLTLVLSVLMQIFSGGIRNTNRAGQHQEAILLAKSKLATIGIESPPIMGETTGRFDDRYQWRVNIYPHQDDGILLYDSQSGVPLALPVALLNASVEVHWNEPDASGSVTLQTLKMVRIQ